jgi:hypothetical protein
MVKIGPGFITPIALFSARQRQTREEGEGGSNMRKAEQQRESRVTNHMQAGGRAGGGRAGTAAGCNKEACPIETGHPVGTVKPADG